MTKYPNRDECLDILKQTGCSEDVIKHCLVVTDIALAIANKITEVDIGLVEAGGLLHDIGRSRTHEIGHAFSGADLARELSLPEELTLIIEKHIAAGIPPETASELGLPPRDYIPGSLEEKIVAHADNLVEGHTRVDIERSIDILKGRGLDEAAERVLKLHQELSELAKMDIDEIK